MKINPFELDENVNYTVERERENNGRDISSSFADRNLTSFDLKEPFGGSRRVEGGKRFSWKGIYIHTLTHINIYYSRRTEVKEITINRVLQ